jgi:septum formation protein
LDDGMKTARATIRFILASSSPRRRQLLREGGIDFRAVSPSIHEPTGGQIGHLRPSQQAEALAYFKARAVADQFPEATVLGADTVVAAADGQVLGKPSDEQQAREMIERLSGTRHAVITGVALLGPGGRRLIASSTSYVTMRQMTADEIQRHIDSGTWQGKAGAYAIQETGDRFIDTVEGSLTNVMGLPMELVERMLTMAGR